MLTESEVIIARYKQTEKESDELGRVIEVRRLRPSEQTKISGMTAELTGFDEMKNANGDTIRLSHRTPLVIAASVCRINGDSIPFPRTRGELDAIYNRLDMEGITAAGKALARLQGLLTEEGEKSEDELAEDEIVKAKN